MNEIEEGLQIQKNNDFKQAVTTMLLHIGENPNREGLADTPNRVLRAYDELFAGYKQNPKDIFTTFDSEGADDIVLLKSIEFYSFCEHHLMSFFGKAHVAYIPNGRVVGISKLARLVDIYARRLQIQERMGMQITKALNDYLQPRGAACIIEAKHMCMCARGVGKQESVMTTSSLTGAFFNSSAARMELMSMIHTNSTI